MAKREGFPALSKALAVMGANGSGKTNAIKVLAFLHWFIGHSFRAEPDEPIPFEPHFFAEDEPSEFELLFDTAGTIYRYGSHTDAPTCDPRGALPQDQSGLYQSFSQGMAGR
ncbi:AAA family ATPase [Lamprobacter modestohalophilus]|uniref:AAA family ATPase n=1 Tax=Lamprobacter modestohalophilus TaxID=1064514 RepID=UPI002ADEE684|nr:AAA family ATPase [Lamprobacter modestohalophilus]MEA1052024.1 AAA family ATPase [Lamprobacter modestohalophilus]